MVFRDNVSHQIGTYVSSGMVVSRTQLVATNEDVTVLTFTSYGLATDPTHISVIVERVGTYPADTLPASVHLLEVQALLPRD